jgi:hypothetical protein
MMASPLPKVINCVLSQDFYVIIFMSLISIAIELTNDGDFISLLLYLLSIMKLCMFIILISLSCTIAKFINSFVFGKLCMVYMYRVSNLEVQYPGY